LNPRFLLDTPIVVRWLIEPKKLSREQAEVLRETVGLQEPVALSAISLLEIAVSFGERKARSAVSVAQLLSTTSNRIRQFGFRR
jgi:PIN domain nuclease of toxin-antitoxin system